MIIGRVDLACILYIFCTFFTICARIGLMFFVRIIRPLVAVWRYPRTSAYICIYNYIYMVETCTMNFLITEGKWCIHTKHISDAVDVGFMWHLIDNAIFCGSSDGNLKGEASGLAEILGCSFGGVRQCRGKWSKLASKQQILMYKIC